MPLTRYLPHVAVATFAVVGLPALIASAVQALLGLGGVLSVVLAMALSILFARAGSALWMRLPASRDIVLGDLRVRGWLRRMRAERRLTRVEQLLGHGELSSVRRTELLKTLASGLEARDSYTHGHSKRVARHAEAIARGMGLSREQVAKIRTAASVHDVGKIRTPRAILSKPGALSDRERSVMERHVAKGAEMVLGLGDAEITAMVRSHHERLDRSGYPDGLRAEDIPLGARIIAVADTFDSMTSARPYRRASSHKHAIDVLAAESGARLDPRAVAAFRAGAVGTGLGRAAGRLDDRHRGQGGGRPASTRPSGGNGHRVRAASRLGGLDPARARRARPSPGGSPPGRRDGDALSQARGGAQGHLPPHRRRRP